MSQGPFVAVPVGNPGPAAAVPSVGSNGSHDSITPLVPPPAYVADSDNDPFKVAGIPFQSERSMRMGFVRKVYAILGAQFLLTCAMSAWYMSHSAIKLWILQHPSHLWGVFIVTMVVLITLLCVRRSYPANMLLLTLFTLLEGHTVATVTTFYSTTVVLQALILTVVLFLALTAFTFQTKWDFEGMGPFLFGTLSILIVVGFVHIFVPFSSVVNLIIAVFSAILFCAYIVFDTQSILDRMSPEDYILGAIELYLDIINLFLNLLQIFGAISDSS
ncbi:hypothetical protein HK105_204881 [Polyrhizophydium stewartii]|uniref:Uncharacterized protein n=1 Tax=Polyrhizophydium stewartii TaxID=2732419 RepID=A0ABR4N7K1_9FUNG|nr:hypothetical protein HK105_000442 [Polyrhizophydium stewartii]